MLQPENSLELLKTVTTENLFEKLVTQLNKDFQLANIDKLFKSTISINKLAEELSGILLHLIQFKYDDYLNLLYRIDISEKELATIKSSNLKDSIEQVSFIILKREFQKVWLKRNYK
ncbi:hypothetical protein BX611_2494 [Lutibacter oceani]|uniref:Uncharacterized protein n=1 Tax=Lutibacter oceani TaxID=1853311 RepID=A0A3D9RUQ5_9FLAO|nr:hypothetical protein [Lutibacter oceani]REE80836.1 hypothetical protein BX611_2494 [Lutibacter oceani]